MHSLFVVIQGKDSILDHFFQVSVALQSLMYPYYQNNDTYYHVNRKEFLEPEKKNALLGGDSIHTRDLYQSNSIYTDLPSVENRTRGIGGNRALHMRHNGKANVFFPAGHVKSLSKSEVTPDTWGVYAAATNPGAN